jgi:hypothetical protein
MAQTEKKEENEKKGLQPFAQTVIQDSARRQKIRLRALRAPSSASSVLVWLSFCLAACLVVLRMPRPTPGHLRPSGRRRGQAIAT